MLSDDVGGETLPSLRDWCERVGAPNLPLPRTARASGVCDAATRLVCPVSHCLSPDWSPQQMLLISFGSSQGNKLTLDRCCGEEASHCHCAARSMSVFGGYTLPALGRCPNPNAPFSHCVCWLLIPKLSRQKGRQLQLRMANAV